MRIGSLFTGAGGLDMAVEKFFDGTTVWRSDIKPAACKLIEQRWPGTNLGDITRIDWNSVGPVDVICGGSPCQDMSQAGRRAGMNADTRSGLWFHMWDAIKTIRPRFVVWENVKGALSAKADSKMGFDPWCLGDGPASGLRAPGRVLGDLAEVGYDAQWVIVSAASVGAPHRRERVFILASDTDGMAREAAIPREGQPGTLGEPEAFAGTLGSSGGTTSDPVSVRQEGGDQAIANHSEADRQRTGDATGVCRTDFWGEYLGTIERWERVVGRQAPCATVPAERGGRLLSPDFVDWMMGWPGGWTDIEGLKPRERLSLGGDGVVPQQALAALQMLAGAE